MDNFVEQVKNKILINDIVSRYTKLQKRGINYVGCCPFHKEKTPSFYVYLQNASYHCYGCKAHGDIFTILIEKKGFTFREALEELADLAGLKIPTLSKESTEHQRKIVDFYKILINVTDFYSEQLNKTIGNNAKKYLNDRGINTESIKKFKLGYADKSNGLLKYLLQFGYQHQDLETLGLIRKSKNNKSYYDYFRDRIIFPITDYKGRVIAFGGRTINAGEPKYINSPDTPIYHKGQVIYGHSFVRENIANKSTKEVICCEGYMDVISLHQHGFLGALAPLGTALTEAQIDLLWKLSPTPILSFDGDKAGENATVKAMELALPLLKPGYSLKFANMQTDADPDSLLKSGNSDVLRKIYNNPEELVDKLWNNMIVGIEINTPEQKSLLKSKIYQTINNIADYSVRKDYTFEINKRIGSYFRSSYDKHFINSNNSIQIIVTNAHDRQIQVLLACILNNPEILADLENELLSLSINNQLLQELRDGIINYLHDNDKLALKDYLACKGYQDMCNNICNYKVYAHGKFSMPNNAKNLNDIINKWKEIYNICMWQIQVKNDLRVAQDLFGKNPTLENQNYLRKVQKKIYDKEEH